MGTRGLYGFYYKGRYYLMYNHWDSYPRGLGMKVVCEIADWFKVNGVDLMKIAFENVIQVTIEGEREPTDEEIEKLKPWTDLSVATGYVHDWYCLLRKTQGSFKSCFDCGFMLVTEEEYKSPSDWGGNLFIEWVYVIDLDNEEFRGYEGGKEFYKSPINKINISTFLSS